MLPEPQKQMVSRLAKANYVLHCREQQALMLALLLSCKAPGV